jgi:hypothetical protein
VLDAAGKAPIARRPIAAFDRDRLGVRPNRPPGHDPARVAEDFSRHRRLDIGRRHGAAAGLHNAPSGTAVGLGEFLDRLHEGDRIDLEAVAAFRQQHAEQPRVVERCDHLGYELPLGFGARRLRRDQRCEPARADDTIAGIVLRR